MLSDYRRSDRCTVEPLGEDSIARLGRRAAAVYVVLWIAEGAVRKWVPGTSVVFYVAKDVFLIAALLWVIVGPVASRRRLPAWMVAAVLILTVYLFLQFVVLHTDPVVLVAGVRSYVAPALLPLLFYLVGSSKWTSLISRIIAVAAIVELIVSCFQVASAPDSVINRQIGGSEAAFVNGGSVVRASGTFSSPIGLTVFLSLGLAFAFGMLSEKRTRGVGLVVLLSILATGAISGSRGALLSTALVTATYLLHGFASLRSSGAVRLLVVAVVVAGTFILVLAVAPAVVNAFADRIYSAGRTEDSPDRLLNNAIGFLDLHFAPLGSGVGSHSNAGIVLGSGSAWIEIDGNRWVAELGMLGYLMSVFRLLAGVAVVLLTLVRLRQSSALSACLGAVAASTLLWGSINQQPSVEGFAAILLTTYFAATIARTPLKNGNNVPPSAGRTLYRSSR